MKTPTGSSARNESIKLSLLLSCLCLVILYGDWLWRWDRLIYDVQSSLIKHQADDDIVIIAIDETSLNSLGRWPWPRHIHANLIDRLTQYQVKAILFDVIFSESTPDKISDHQLAQAIFKNTNVVLPVLLEQTRLRGHLLETLPLPELTQAAANLGHVHVELDPDGIARGSYLYEGLGNARWPHISLALLQMIDEVDDSVVKQPGSVKTAQTPWNWVRQGHFLIPYIGPPGSYQTTSYLNVLENQILPETLKDKIILVGVTAAGLGDSLPTPVSGLARSMPGIEINANILQAIKSGTLINTVSTPLLYLIACALVMLPVLLFPYLSPRMTLILLMTEISLIFLSTLVLLHWLHIWVPVSAALICLLLSYPLWAWRRLEFTIRYLDTELETLSLETREIQRYVAQDNEQPFEVLQNLIPIQGLLVTGMNNEALIEYGETISDFTNQLSIDNWTNITDKLYARKIFIANNLVKVYIFVFEKMPPNEQQLKILKTYIRQKIKPVTARAKTTVEIIESRIRDIQTTTDKLAYLRHFISDSLEQMADGVIVTDNLGIITLINRQASLHINNQSTDNFLHKPIRPVLDALSITTGESWDTIISSLLSNKHYENLQVLTDNEKNLIVNISSLYNSDRQIIGFIINLSDITEIKDAERKRSEMLSFLSHDLRSPLISILAMLENSKTDRNENLLHTRIENNINHTIQLAEDFVHLSRIESNEDFSFSNINLADVIANSVDTVWDQANIKNISIEQNFTINGWVTGNGAILERVFINLLTNAIKYSDENCRVAITLIKQSSNIICTITDNGPGISDSDLPHLFDRFKRAQQHTKNKTDRANEKKHVPHKQQAQRSEQVPAHVSGQVSGQVSGLGLGLAFVHAAIERHHGSITVTSQLQQGTCFTIMLPEAVNA